MLADNLRTVRETIASALTKRTEKKEPDRLSGSFILLCFIC